MAELRLRAMGMAAALAAFAENKHAQKAYAHCVAEYAAKIDEVCENIGMPSAQIKIKEADFLTSVTTALQVSYLCRKTDCGFYGMNDQWIQHETRYHFRCPHCGMQYFPWRQAEKWYKFQKVISVSHPNSGERWIIPALWPDSAEDNFLQKMMVATASNLQTMADVDDLIDGRIQAIETLLANVGQPAVFKRFTLSQDVKNLVEHCSGFGKTQYAKIDEHGYYGEILSPTLGASEPFEDWNEFCALFGSLMVAGEQIAHKLNL